MDMVKAEMSSIINDVNTNEQADKPREIPSVAKHILLFMFIRPFQFQNKTKTKTVNSDF